jgi:hypothetical protein
MMEFCRPNPDPSEAQNNKPSRHRDTKRHAKFFDLFSSMRFGVLVANQRREKNSATLK